MQGDRESAQRAYEEAVSIAREIRDPQLLAWSLLDLADVPTWAKDYDRAEAMLKEGLASAEEAADRPLESEVRAVLGRLAYYRGDLATAHDAYQEAIAIQRGIGADRLVAINVARLADVEVRLGQLDAAEEHYREFLVMVTEAGNDVISAVDVGVLGLGGQPKGLVPACRALDRGGGQDAGGDRGRPDAGGHRGVDRRRGRSAEGAG